MKNDALVRPAVGFRSESTIDDQPRSFSSRNRVTALHRMRAMRGGTRSQLMFGSNSRCWVVKFQNNPQHYRVLANEWLASSLARLVGLSVPETAVVDVDPWLVKASPFLANGVGNGKQGPWASGPSFGSLYAGGLIPGSVLDILPENGLQKVINLQEFLGMLVLDKWTGNSDARQAVFVRQPNRKNYKAVFIDFGHCFNAGSWTFPDSPLSGVYAKKSVYGNVTGWRCFEPWLSKIQNISLETLRECADGMPSEWYGGRVDLIEAILNRLHRRKDLITSLIHQYRMSDANPFPKWKPCPSETRNILRFGNPASLVWHGQLGVEGDTRLHAHLLHPTLQGPIWPQGDAHG